MTLNNFSGGLNTRLSPNLIQVSESIICENVDLESGTIKPLKGLVATSTTIPLDKEGFTLFKGTWIKDNESSSFVEFNDKLYFTNSVDTVKKTSDGINVYELGLDAPSTKVTTSSSYSPTFTLSNLAGSVTGFVSGTTYTYLIEYVTEFGAIVYEEKTFTYTSTGGIQLAVSSIDGMKSLSLYRYYGTKFRLVSDTLSTNIQDTTYDISSNSGLSTYSDTIPVLNYVYTYYSSSTGFESAPSPVSDDLEVKYNNITISGIVLPPDSSVDAINIYRLGNTLTDYYLVAAVSKTTTSYIDTQLDLDILDAGILLETSGYIKPPEGLKFLIEYNAALFASIDSTLYFSNSGLVDIWTDYNYIVFPEHITGLGVTQNGLLIFSRNKTWILVGTDLNSYSKYLLNGSQGCLSNSTIGYVDNNLLWQSLDGICTSSGGAIELLSWNALGKVAYNPIKAVVYENQYLLFHEEGCLVIDFRQGVKFYTLELIVRGAYYSPLFDTLYLLKPSDIGMYEYNKGTSLTYKYKTGWIAENGITNYKTYKNIYIYCIGTSTLKVYINDILVTTIQLKDGVNDVKVPQATSKGYFIAFEFEGTGTIVELNMNSEWRQNGR